MSERPKRVQREAVIRKTSSDQFELSEQKSTERALDRELASLFRKYKQSDSEQEQSTLQRSIGDLIDSTGSANPLGDKMEKNQLALEPGFRKEH